MFGKSPAFGLPPASLLAGRFPLRTSSLFGTANACTTRDKLASSLDTHARLQMMSQKNLAANAPELKGESPDADTEVQFIDAALDDDMYSEVFEGAAAPVSTRMPAGVLPTVAVVGRPNVGKSMLVNRLAGQFTSGSIVEDVVGITRDRTYRPAFWGEHHFQIVDTGGLVFDDDSTFLPEIRAQALIALAESTAAILVVDGQAGLNPLDVELAKFIRRECGHIPVFLAVNKCESDRGLLLASEFWALGLGQPYGVSAIHGTGTGDLLDAVVIELPVVERDLDDGICNVAIVGRPNVGKSSLLNVIAGKERAIVSDIPGTTRDAIDELVSLGDSTYRLIDTAGIRRKTSVSYGTEFFMINRAFKAIRRSDVALLVIDVDEGATDQDRKIAERIALEGKACVIIANKWDLIDEKDNSSYKKAVQSVRDKLSCIPWAEVELVSALSRQRTAKILEYVDIAHEQNSRRVGTSVLNDILREAVDWHKPPSTKQAKQGRIYYCTQVASCPPTIAMFVNDPQLFRDGYRRYMERQFRESLGFRGTPIRIMWRGKAKAPAL
jgi:GTPase